MTPSCCVIIPTFNRQRYVRLAVLSVLSEKMSSLEIIVVDDGSTDSTSLKLSDLPIRYFRLERNSGISAARNYGIRQTKADLITFLDSDDLLVPDGLAWRLQWLVNHPQHEAIGGIVAGHIGVDGESIRPPSGLQTGEVAPVSVSRDTIERRIPFCAFMPLFLFRARLLAKVGYFNEELKVNENGEYLYRVLGKTPQIYFENRPVFWRRLHKTNLSLEVSEEGAITRRRESRKELAIRCLSSLALLTEKDSSP